jgi:DNA-directed RNA polymerase specialized sigma subunit
VTREQMIRNTVRGFCRDRAMREVERSIRLQRQSVETTTRDLAGRLKGMAFDAEDNASILFKIADEVAPAPETGDPVLDLPF